jgi:hypothetical protein
MFTSTGKNKDLFSIHYLLSPYFKVLNGKIVVGWSRQVFTFRTTQVSLIFSTKKVLNARENLKKRSTLTPAMSR